MSLLEASALDSLRTGPYRDAATSLAWLVGLVAVAAGFWWGRTVRRSSAVEALVVVLGLVVAGVALALVATSVSRAVSASVAFGVTLVVCGLAWGSLTGSAASVVTTPGEVDLLISVLLVLFVPSAVAAGVRRLV